METMFVLTHTAMLICLTGIICVSIPGIADRTEMGKPPAIAMLLAKVKSIQISTAYISRTATALLTLLLR